MKATASISGGLCALDEKSTIRYVNINGMTTIPYKIAHLVCGAVDDWEVIEAPNQEAILIEVRERHKRARIIANIESCLCGVSYSIQHELLEETEDILKTLDVHDQLAAMMLRAPLVEHGAIKALIKDCLAEGFGAVASLLDRVLEAQPLILRLADRWMSIPEEVFSPLSGGRQQAWRLAVANLVLLKTLTASNLANVEREWALLALLVSTPAERMCYVRIAKKVAQSLFPEDQEKQPELAVPNEVDSESRWTDRHQARPDSARAYAAYERAIKQIEAIAAAVSEGHDGRARKFLRDLVDSQMAYEGGEEHVVKSLCNIAHQCSEMFRTDFEYECLQTAISIRPNDGWTHIQLADHYKRVGRFVDAINSLKEAESLGENRMAMSSLADVYVHMKKYEEALQLYEQIPEAESDPKIRGAKADMLRRRGLFEAASAEYARMIDEGLIADRAYAGLAEIAKRQGRLEEARSIYQMLLDQDLNEQASVIYRAALANVLVRQGDLSEAFQKLDEAVQMRPFAREFRVYRAAVAGLLGDPLKAIDELPHLGVTHAFNEWVNNYIRGLLLLMLERYRDAGKALEQHVEEQLLNDDASTRLRLGTAVLFLREREGVKRAARVLENVPEIKDTFADAIRAALQYHVAVSLKQAEDIRRLHEQLQKAEDKDLRETVIAIDQRKWNRAWQLEVRMLIRLAA